MVAWIIGGHALAGYAAIGGWQYDEVNEVTLSKGSEKVLAAIIGPSALFVIGVFFFIAGLFTPQAVDRKGPARYAKERAVRFGLPFLAFALLLWPMIMVLTYAASGRSVSYWWVMTGRKRFLDSGPLWFVAVLLLLSLTYAAHRMVTPAPSGKRWRGPLRGSHLVYLVAGMVLVSFVLRMVFPVRGSQIFDLHIWQWPQCAAMFGLGIVGARMGLAERIPDSLRRGCGWTVVLTVGALPLIAFVLGIGDLATDAEPFLGGWHWQSLLLAVIEAMLVVAGSVWLLGFAQRRLTHTGPLATSWARSSYTAFILQGPVLLAAAIALRPLPAPAEVKAFLVAGAAITVSFWLANVLVSHTRLSRIL